MEKNEIFRILVFVLGGAIYLFPSYIGRKHRNQKAIFIINILLGWTFLGWIVSLVMGRKASSKTMNNYYKKNIIEQTDEYYENEIQKLKDLYYNGFLRQREFLFEVTELLNQKAQRKIS